MTTKTLTIPRALLASDINSYSDTGHARKKAFHTAGRTFLKNLAARLGLTAKDYDLRNNEAGIAVSGEVTLHADHLYVQLSESCFGDAGISALFRTCQHRKDYGGGQNHFVSLTKLAHDPDALERFVSQCQKLNTPA